LLAIRPNSLAAPIGHTLINTFVPIKYMTRQPIGPRLTLPAPLSCLGNAAG
jgi:hypothetical protein